MHEMSSSSAPPPTGGLTFAVRVVSTGDASRTGQQIDVDRPLVIGRDPQADLVLADASVSRRHARIEQDGSQLKLVDLNSGNGVWMGSERVSEIALTAGNQFRIGSTTFECVAIGSPVPTVGSARPTGTVTIRIIEGGDVEQAGREFTITGPSVMGRGDDVQIKLAEKDISRRHARIEVTPEGILLTDLGSTGGTWLGASEVTSQLLKPGDRFRLGGSLVLECAQVPAEGAAPELEPEVAEVEDDSTRFVTPSEVAAAMAAVAAAPDPAPMPVLPPPVRRRTPPSRDTNRLPQISAGTRCSFQNRTCCRRNRV